MDEHISLDHFGGLEGHQYMSLSTFRKDGTAVATAVWFADSDGTLYVTTADGTGKVKRIRNNPSVTVAPCDRSGRVLGDAVEGRARMVPEVEEDAADKKLLSKYGLVYRGFGTVRSVVARQSRKVFIEISAPNCPDNGEPRATHDDDAAEKHEPEPGART